MNLKQVGNVVGWAINWISSNGISLKFPFLTACSNPLLYGWLNDNFRKEFNEILCCSKANQNSTSSTLRLKAIDASTAGKKRALSDVSDIDKQSKLLLRPHNHHIEVMDLKSEFTL